MNVLSPPAERLAGSERLTTEEMATYEVGAVWARSAHSTQPWWFSASGQQISLLAGAGRQLMVADPGGRPPAPCPSAACEHLGSGHG
jgi:hypothetical protein